MQRLMNGHASRSVSARICLEPATTSDLRTRILAGESLSGARVRRMELEPEEVRLCRVEYEGAAAHSSLRVCFAEGATASTRFRYRMNRGPVAQLVRAADS